MNQPKIQRQIGRSILAVLTGALVAITATLVTDAALHAVGVFPGNGTPSPAGPLLLATAYRTFYGVLSSWLTARMAPYFPLRHALVGGLLGFGASLAGAIATWNATATYGPHWYPVALVVLARPQAWLGGWLVERKAR